jgi:hypothetical protein
MVARRPPAALAVIDRTNFPAGRPVSVTGFRIRDRGIVLKRLPLILTIALRHLTRAKLRTRSVNLRATTHRLERGRMKAVAPRIGAGLKSLETGGIAGEANALDAVRTPIRVAIAAVARSGATRNRERETPTTVVCVTCTSMCPPWGGLLPVASVPAPAPRQRPKG